MTIGRRNHEEVSRSQYSSGHTSRARSFPLRYLFGHPYARILKRDIYLSNCKIVQIDSQYLARLLLTLCGLLHRRSTCNLPATPDILPYEMPVLFPEAIAAAPPIACAPPPFFRRSNLRSSLRCKLKWSCPSVNQSCRPAGTLARIWRRVLASQLPIRWETGRIHASMPARQRCLSK
jgi:hypothetical protein